MASSLLLIRSWVTFSLTLVRTRLGLEVANTIIILKLVLGHGVASGLLLQGPLRDRN